MSSSYSSEKPHTFSLGIADFTIRVKCNHGSLAEAMAERYAEFQPGLVKSLSAQVEWVGRERSSSLLNTQTNFHDGILQFSAPGYHGFIDEYARQGYLELSSAQPVEDIDYFLRVVLALLVQKIGGVLLHTAGIVRDKRAYLFLGHSGSGKTTICRSSMEEFLILNDDLILLKPNMEEWIAYGTPFWNPTQIKPTNQFASIAGIYLLIQDKSVYTQELAAGKATAALISNVPIIPLDPVRSVQLLEVLSKIQRNVPIYELHFLPDNSFWDVILG